MRAIVFLLIFALFVQNTCYAFSLPFTNNNTKKTEQKPEQKKPFFKKEKKQKDETEPMVHTVDEWLERSTSVNMDNRKAPVAPKEIIVEKFIPPEKRPTYIERYNVKAGSRELDLTKLYKEQTIRSNFVSDPNFQNAVYSEVYFYPQTKQTASTLYLIQMDKGLSKKEKLENLSVFEHTRYPLISTALPYLKEDFFSTLTLVDFSPTGKEILVKEKRGSHRYGIYETYVWIYFLTKEDKNKNNCYLNNLAFSNEMGDFLEGNFNGSSAFEIKGSPFDNSPDLNSLTPPPNMQLNNNNGANSKGEIINTPDMSWLKESVPKKKKNGLKSIDDPTFTYNDIKDFIKAVWKDELMTSPAKTRWYNTVPVDFRADIPVSSKESLGFGVRLNLLNETIKAYWFDKQELILNMIRWNLNPLGFNSANKNEIIVSAWAFRQDGKQISLGLWGVDIRNGMPRLIPDTETISVGANAFFLEEKLNSR